MRHRNIPFFVPHAGCPNACVFCSQVKITGKKIEKDRDLELAELRELLDSVGEESIKNSDNRIAFFGGSFTAIERGRMINLLSVAKEYIEKGVASGIRISTRPDCIDGEILDILEEYGVKEIELGIQSTDNKVLTLSGRGHTAEDSYRACEMILKRGFTLGGQMMTGLPGATIESEVKTASDIVRMGAKESRIYPTVVFEGTELYRMTQRGEYTPLDTEDAVRRSAACYRIFLDNNVKVLKVGLHSSENLRQAPCGANHPSIGELIKGRVLSDIIAEKAQDCEGRILDISVGKSQLSMLKGHGGAEIKRLAEITKADSINVKAGNEKDFCPEVGIRSK